MLPIKSSNRASVILAVSAPPTPPIAPPAYFSKTLLTTAAWPVNLGINLPANLPPKKNPAPPRVLASPAVTASNLASSNKAPKTLAIILSLLEATVCAVDKSFPPFIAPDPDFANWAMYLVIPAAPATLLATANLASSGTK